MKYLLSITALIIIILLAQEREIVIERKIDYRQPYLAGWQAPMWPVKKTILATITGYSSDPAETDDTPFLMANGKQVGPGAIACPKELPFGTTVEVFGKTYYCSDRMNLKHEGKFDIWFENKEDAISFGVKKEEVLIY